MTHERGKASHILRAGQVAGGVSALSMCCSHLRTPAEEAVQHAAERAARCGDQPHEQRRRRHKHRQEHEGEKIAKIADAAK